MSLLPSLRRAALASSLGMLFLSGTAVAEIDLSGVWVARVHEDFLERGTGPDMVEYEGLPISESGRARALSWDPSLLTLEEYQCRPHPSDYYTRFANFRFTKLVNSETQSTIGWHMRKVWQAAERTIWMDGRERPPEFAAHTFQGFSLGKWEGDVLSVETTHLKQSYIRRNGVARSDRATTREHYARHGNYVTVIVVIRDPANLTESMIRSSDYELNNQANIPPYPCDPTVEIAGQPKGLVPAYLPGKHPFLTEYADKYKLPLEAVLGGAQTMYPEYMQKVRELRSGQRTSAARE
ncbi:MAG: hypothetical protein RLZZ403_151 [Pseudomonadota bacterium]|jgi:hypothetical protein